MLREMLELIAYHSRFTMRFAERDVRNGFEKTIRDLQRLGFGGIQQKRILDLGCGQRYPFALQCAASGARVTAMDINYVRPGKLLTAFYRTLEHNGLKRALKSAARPLVWDNRYFRALETFSGRPLRPYRSSIQFVTSDPRAGEYPLPDNSFALIASNVVLEHVKDVSVFAAEVARLLDVGGYFYAIIHNYYSLSGGHCFEWTFPDESPSSNVPPWDHLRQKCFPAWTYLNAYKPEQYIDAFSRYLSILRFEGVGVNHEPGELEGERFLTPDLVAELSGYSRDLLLTRSWCMICKKA